MNLPSDPPARRFLLVTVGSRGDVHPFLALGRELGRRGHEVCVLTAEPHAGIVAEAGLDFESVLSRPDYERALQDPDLWHPRRGMRTVMELVGRTLEPIHAALERRYEPGRTTVVGHSLALAARAFEEQRGAPTATVHLSPNALRSVHDPPVLPPHLDLRRWPAPLQHAFWWVADRFGVDPLIRPWLDPFRRRLGLPPVKRVFGAALHAPRCTLALFPPWFAAPQPDWPSQVRAVGFARWDGPDEQLPDELEAFLAAGEPPLAFTGGSANVQARALLEVGLVAAQRLGRRALVCSPPGSDVPPTDGVRALHVPYAPYSALLPRVAALTHHGGIGTTAQALAAGVPQLVVPHGFDQPDNAERLRRLGVARVLAPGALDPAAATEALGRLVAERDVATACARFARELRGADGAAPAADRLEALR